MKDAREKRDNDMWNSKAKKSKVWMTDEWRGEGEHQWWICEAGTSTREIVGIGWGGDTDERNGI